MNLYLLTQDTNKGWDTYDSAIVLAKTAEEAREVVPGSDPDAWVSPSAVTVEFLGPYLGVPRLSPIVLSSYNAG